MWHTNVVDVNSKIDEHAGRLKEHYLTLCVRWITNPDPEDVPDATAEWGAVLVQEQERRKQRAQKDPAARAKLPPVLPPTYDPHTLVDNVDLKRKENVHILNLKLQGPPGALTPQSTAIPPTPPPAFAPEISPLQPKCINLVKDMEKEEEKDAGVITPRNTASSPSATAPTGLADTI